MTNIRLRGHTKRAKQIVKDNGEDWDVVKFKDNVLFDERDGPWVLVRSKDGTAVRWVHMHFDKQFIVVNDGDHEKKGWMEE